MYAVIFKDCIEEAENAPIKFDSIYDALDEYDELRKIYSVELPEFLNQLCVVKICNNMRKEVVWG